MSPGAYSSSPAPRPHPSAQPRSCLPVALPCFFWGPNSLCLGQAMLHGQNPGPCADLFPSLVSSPPPLEKLQAALPEHRLRSQGRLSCCSLYLHGKKPFSAQKMRSEAFCLGQHSPWGLSGERQRCFLPYDTKIEAEASPSHRSRGWGVPSPVSPSARLPFFPIQARNHHGDTWQCRHFATDHGDPRGGAVGLASGARGASTSWGPH